MSLPNLGAQVGNFTQPEPEVKQQSQSKPNTNPPLPKYEDTHAHPSVSPVASRSGDSESHLAFHYMGNSAVGGGRSAGEDTSNSIPRSYAQQPDKPVPPESTVQTVTRKGVFLWLYFDCSLVQSCCFSCECVDHLLPLVLGLLCLLRSSFAPTLSNPILCNQL